MSTRSPLNKRRALRWRVAGGFCGGVVAVSAPLAGNYFHDHQFRAGVLQLLIGLLAVLLCGCCWLLWQIPETAFRMAIPSFTTKGGCSKCTSRFATTSDDFGNQGIVVWHDVECLDGARVESRMGETS